MGWKTDGASGIGSRLGETGILGRLSQKIGATPNKKKMLKMKGHPNMSLKTKDQKSDKTPTPISL
jgi:hypothetical protein